jgi:hypothetical protein
MQIPPFLEYPAHSQEQTSSNVEVQLTGHHAVTIKAARASY